MAEDNELTPNSSNTQERTLLDVVNELKELNSATAVAQDSATYTQDLRDYVTSQGDNLSSKQLSAIEDLISAMQSGELDQMEMDKERIARNEERNDLLESIAKYTSLSLDQLREEFGGKDRGIIMSMLINAAIRGAIIGVMKGIYDSYKFLGKGFLAVGKGIGKFLRLDKFYKAMSTSVSGAMKSAVANIKGMFGGGGKPGIMGKMFASLKAGITKMMPFLKDLFKLTKTIATNVKAITIGVGGFFAGAMGSLKALTNLNFKPTMLSKPFIAASKLMGRFFAPLKDFTQLFSKVFEPMIKNLNAAGKSTKSASKGVQTLGSTIVNFFKALKPVKTAFGILGKVGAAFSGIGRVFGRLFLPITIIMGIFDGLKGATKEMDKYKDAGFFSKLFAGTMGFLSGVLQGLIGIPLDLLKSLVAWIAGKLGFEGVQEFLSRPEFNIKDIIANLFSAIIGGVMGFVQSIKDTIADIGVAGLVQNLALDLLKIFKKIILFPAAVAAGAIKGLAAAWPGGKTPGEAFMEGFNRVFTMGDASIDSMKVQGDGMTESGEEIKSKSEENASGQASLASRAADTAGSVIDASKNAVTNVGDTIINTISPQDRTSATVDGPYG
jgi:hypothetical protein